VPYINSLRHSAASARDAVQRATQLLYDISLEPNPAQRQMLITKLYETILKQIRTASQDLLVLQNIIASKGASATGTNVGTTDAERAQRLGGMALLQPRSPDFSMSWVDVKKMEAMMDDYRSLLDIYYKSQLEYPFFVSKSNQKLYDAALQEQKEIQGVPAPGSDAPYDRSEETFDHREERIFGFSRLCAELSQTADALANQEVHQATLQEALVPILADAFNPPDDGNAMGGDGMTADGINSTEPARYGTTDPSCDATVRLASRMLANLPRDADETPAARAAKIDKNESQLRDALCAMFRGDGLKN